MSEVNLLTWVKVFAARSYFELCLVLALILSVWADPTFAKVGPIEVTLAFVIAMFIVLAFLEFFRAPDLSGLRKNWPLTLYITSLGLSAVVGLISGAHPSAIFRALAPYSLIVPALVLLCRKNPILDHRVLLWGVALAGGVQALHLICLYFAANDRFDSEFQIMVHRITLIDLRATIPVAISSVSVVIILGSENRNYFVKIFFLLLASVIMLASFTTIARTHVLSAGMGLCVLIVLTLIRPWFFKSSEYRLGPFFVAALSTLLAVTVLATIPALNILPKTVFLRQAIETDHEQVSIDVNTLNRVAGVFLGNNQAAIKVLPSQNSDQIFHQLAQAAGVDGAFKILDLYAKEESRSQPQSQAESGKEQKANTAGSPPESDAESDTSGKRASDSSRTLKTQLVRSVVSYNNGMELTLGSGRIEDEWVPAWHHFSSSDLATKFFGIGAGNSFVTKSGEKRTYIHNYPLYLLVFRGICGLVCFLVMMTWVGWRLLTRWLVDGNEYALAMLGVATAMYSNSILFATHKLISFNLLSLVVVLVGCITHRAANGWLRKFETEADTLSVTNPRPAG